MPPMTRTLPSSSFTAPNAWRGSFMLRSLVLAREAGRLVCPSCLAVEVVPDWPDDGATRGVAVGSGVVSPPQEAHTAAAASTRSRVRNFESGGVIVIVRQWLCSGLVALFRAFE
ncbi:MAG: hypothetical protein F4Y50_15145 [Dehalococcoidia bacterium]|nr:hypothetical protein [Dehalococcoidia bacterium]